MSQPSEETFVIRRPSGEFLAADKAHTTYSPRLAWTAQTYFAADRLAEEKNAELCREPGQYYGVLYGWRVESIQTSSTHLIEANLLLKFFVASIRSDGTASPRAVLAFRKHALAWLAACDEAEAEKTAVNQLRKTA